MGKLIRGTSKSSRFVVMDTKDIINDIIIAQNIDDTLTADILSKIVGFAICLSTNMKSFKNLTVRVDSNSYIKNITVIIDEDKNVKAYVSKNEEYEETTHATLRVIKDFGLKEPYTAISNIDLKNILDDISSYFYHSEQIPTFISVGSSFNDDGSLKNSGGFMVQLMPGADEKFIDKMEEKSKIIRPINQLLDGKMSLIDIIKLIYEDIDSENDAEIEKYEILSEENIIFKCNCNKEKFKNGVITLGKSELQNIFDEEENIEVACQFCNKKYKFSREDFSEILDE